MKKGRIKISTALITDALQFPPDWEIESMSFNSSSDQYISAVISGSDFPETTNIEGAEIKNCQIIFHKEAIRIEVKKI